MPDTFGLQAEKGNQRVVAFLRMTRLYVSGKDPKRGGYAAICADNTAGRSKRRCRLDWMAEREGFEPS